MRKFALFSIVLIALTARLLPGPRTIDDSFITFRYTRNILSANGFVFNAGERVLGTTTPFYTLLLTALSTPFGGTNANFPVLAWLLNAGLDAMACVVLIQIGKKFKYPIPGFAAGILWAIAPFSVTFSIGGLETSLFILLILWVVYAWISRKTGQLFLSAALLILTRPDGAILLAPLGLYYGWEILRNRRWKEVIKKGWLFILPTTIWIAFSWIYFGGPIPHSITAKSVAYLLSPGSALLRLVQHYSTPFMENYTLPPMLIFVGGVFYLTFFILGMIKLARKDPQLFPVMLFPLLYFVIYSVANPLLFRWYLSPPLPIYFLGILIGLNELVRAFASKLSMRSYLTNGIMGLAVSYFIVLTCRGWIFKGSVYPEMAYIELEKLYLHVAKDLQPQLQPGDVIAAGDVGVLGYYTGATILDTVGLNSPVATTYFPQPESAYVINYAIPTQLVLDTEPTYLVTLEVYIRNTLKKSSEFDQMYTLLESYPTTIYGSDAMLVYQRNP